MDLQPLRKNDIVQNPRGGWRETVESMVVAFVLALLFRSFEAEAFVIPTGSMANTLMGRHRDLVCETCGTSFRVGASKELDDGSCTLNPRAFVRQARCPCCGVFMRLTDAAGRYKHDYPAFAGDRILVEKFAYDFAEPKRWDVMVFKYPEDAKTNYIKRLIGLPGETVAIAAGDIWTSRGEEDAVIARKPPDRMRAMLQTVHDSRRVATPLREAGFPDAWSDWVEEGAGPRWTTSDSGRSYSVTAAGPAMLRWRRLLPEAFEPGQRFAGTAEPALVGDFQPYNQDPEYRGLHRSLQHGCLLDGAHWVGDLAIECQLESQSGTGVVTFDLVKAGVRHVCSIDLATGSARLAREGDDPVHATAATAVRGKGRWKILFANVDDEMSLAVNGRRVTTEGKTTWHRNLVDAVDSQPSLRGGKPGDTAACDLAPVGVTVTGGSVRVADMMILRDIYYIASSTLAGFHGREAEERFQKYPLHDDQFFVLGDNSSASKDCRAWGTLDAPLHHVDRRLLVGRALVVWWPHAVPTPWNVKVGERCGWELRLPFLPNFARMRFVR
jgi:signal peptidase I